MEEDLDARPSGIARADRELRVDLPRARPHVPEAVAAAVPGGELERKPAPVVLDPEAPETALPLEPQDDPLRLRVARRVVQRLGADQLEVAPDLERETAGRPARGKRGATRRCP
jgi:hypothetical protein